MLKWAVNESIRQSYYQPETISNNSTSNPTTLLPSIETPKTIICTPSTSKTIEHRCTLNSSGNKRTRRKSTGGEMTNIRRKIFKRDKENNLTSTPIPLINNSVKRRSLRHMNSFKDLSNISESPVQTPCKTHNQLDYGQQYLTTPVFNNPQYATTLPTFDIEYSPCTSTAVPFPGPILALRGVGIADSYFEKPRYLTDNQISETISKSIDKEKMHTKTKTPRRSFSHNSFLSRKSFTRLSSKKHQQNSDTTAIHLGDESLSSSRMGDITLDKMIDAILESARKEKRMPKFRNTRASNHQFKLMSPTYTPAEDPASDLNEMWDSFHEKYLPDDGNSRKRRRSSESDSYYNEREVKTPENWCAPHNVQCNQSIESEEELVSCRLKRQKAVRRKRKFSLAKQFLTNTTTLKDITQRSLFTPTISSTFRRKSIDELAAMTTPKCNYSRFHRRFENNDDNNCNNNNNNISPDSGRNSPSDLEIESIENLTKKKLSFSGDSSLLSETMKISDKQYGFINNSYNET